MSKPILKLTNVSKSFAGVQALEDISLEVEPGKVLCLLGDNGAGKSTLIKILAGFHKPTSGTMFVNGERLFSIPQRMLRHKALLRFTSLEELFH